MADHGCSSPIAMMVFVDEKRPLAQMAQKKFQRQPRMIAFLQLHVGNQARICEHNDPSSPLFDDTEQSPPLVSNVHDQIGAA